MPDDKSTPCWLWAAPECACLSVCRRTQNMFILHLHVMIYASIFFLSESGFGIKKMRTIHIFPSLGRGYYKSDMALKTRRQEEWGLLYKPNNLKFLAKWRQFSAVHIWTFQSFEIRLWNELAFQKTITSIQLFFQNCWWEYDPEVLPWDGAARGRVPFISSPRKKIVCIISTCIKRMTSTQLSPKGSKQQKRVAVV